MVPIMDSNSQFVTQMVNTSLTVDEENSRTIFLVGNKSVGKSTFISFCLDKIDTPQETLVLDYSYGRKTNQKQGIEKNICHIWEYGGKLEMMNNVLPAVPINGKYYFCIMLDLSKIQKIWNTLELCIQTVKETYSSPKLTPELIIICAKYDLFKLYDSEIKKFLYTSLRSVAMLLNAHLLCYSSKDPQLVKRTKDMFHNIGFGSGNSFKDINKSTNYMKPLFIPKGSDSWESIGIAESTLEQIKTRHLSRIPFVMEVSSGAETSSLQQSHPEPSLDALIALKYEELRNSNTLEPSTEEYLIKIL